MARVLVARPAARQRSARMPLRSMALIPVPRSVPGRPHRRGCRGSQCLRPHCPVGSPLHPLRSGIIHFLCANGVRLRARRAFEDPLRKVSESRQGSSRSGARHRTHVLYDALCSPQGQVQSRTLNFSVDLQRRYRPRGDDQRQSRTLLHSERCVRFRG
jgi:hypothetical protein